ncbi:ferrous iron transport protein A [Oscillibacter hominis]|uniref:Ferrous iron transport protein A n=2 Tax=Oscillospiraceae TaxID=216572 RepID=A0A7G9B2C1_9FIRM|nr:MULTISPECIES: FeoA family protein [Oscillospiraceae]MBU5626276.1 ferrous iron transport protein A [Dysosmobacter acutus]QNL43702.1 ferrous iron transport protein A [Oscillibacter hominis]
MTALSDLREGQRGQVVSLLTRDSMRRRLQDIGLIEGTEVECVLKSPAGDPAAYQIRGALIALRREDSDQVMVLPA